MKLLAARIFVFYEIAPPGLQNLIADLIYIRNEKYTILQIIRIYEPKSRLFKGMGIWIGAKIIKTISTKKRIYEQTFKCISRCKNFRFSLNVEVKHVLLRRSK